MSIEDKVIREYRWRALKVFMAWVVPAAPIAAYLNGMSMGVAGWEGVKAVAWVLPPILVGLGMIYPAVFMRWLVGSALRTYAGDRPGARLERILRLPWRVAVGTSWVGWTLGGFWFSLHVCLTWHKDLGLVVLGTIIGVCCGVLLGFPISVSLERMLLPLALEEQRKDPTVVLQGGGFSWPRQAWFLPFTFGGSIVAALVLSGCVVMVKLEGIRDTLHLELVAEGAQRSARMLMELGGVLAGELAFSLAWVGGLLLLPGITTWMLARRQARAAEAVGQAIESVAAGRVVAPAWVSTDEVGDLAAGMNAVLARLRQLPLALQASAARLGEAGSHLRTANDEQQQSFTKQAAALHEAQVTSEEIRRTSRMAADRADAVLQVAKRAEELGLKGEAAVERSVAGLADIRGAVDGIQQRLAKLAESTTQIGDITETVKDLAAQSHLLAVNAAIEAARSGEQGKGFAVVAREVRALADQSIQSTQRIRRILQEITEGIRDAASMGEQGVRTIGTGLDQMRSSGDSLRELSLMSQENSAAARQIAAAVTQQNAGISQISIAIADLSQIMDATMKRLESTQEATRSLAHVSGEVGQMARQFNVAS
ncbi:HAMP domain-containing protein [Myxococcus sp. CA056]|uniref:methyl-accepting chemotaxis protein n=2 Tax=Myxococcus TaxID=32 RepID=UPI00157B0D20|nr:MULTISPECIES: methyl-accepting chemotaxis protein [unclassified Myxococcus]NTX09152.1 HAMP domain-containing protein [Myxococcus sp. CA056]NTX39674.1 HAMP domain-containing protein [Myxococcus sp. CA033]